MTDNKKFQIIGSYFVDLCYNNLYQRAKSDQGDYQNIMAQYIGAIRGDPKLQRRLTEQVYKYYKLYMEMDDLEYNRFLSDICEQLVVKEAYKRIQPEHKEEIVIGALYNLLSKLSTFMTSEQNISNVVVPENRQGEIAKKFTESARDYSVKILIAYRTILGNKYIEKSTGVKTKMNVSSNQIENFKKAISRLIRENIELKRLVEKYRRRAHDLQAELEELEGQRDDEHDPQNDDDKSDREPRKQMHSKLGSQKIDASFFEDDASDKSNILSNITHPKGFGHMSKNVFNNKATKTVGTTQSSKLHENNMKMAGKVPSFALSAFATEPVNTDPAVISTLDSKSLDQDTARFAVHPREANRAGSSDTRLRESGEQVHRSGRTSNEPGVESSTSDSLTRLEQMVESLPDS